MAISPRAKRILPVLIILLSGAGGFAGYRMWNKPHDNLSEKKADITISAAEIIAAFVADENAANTKFLTKVVEITGTVQDIKPSDNGTINVFIRANASDDTGVSCGFVAESAAETNALKVGANATIRGECTGSTIMMGMGGDVNIARCIVVSE